MKELSGQAATRVAAPPERCIELLAAVDGYPRWYPEVVRSAEVLERGSSGAPRQAAATVQVAVGPINRSFDLLLDVEVSPREVRLVRIPHEASDEEEFEVLWTVSEHAPTEVSVALRARLDVPRLLPLGDLGGGVAQGFVDAARRALEAPSPNASASSS